MWYIRLIMNNKKVDYRHKFMTRNGKGINSRSEGDRVFLSDFLLQVNPVPESCYRKVPE